MSLNLQDETNYILQTYLFKYQEFIKKLDELGVDGFTLTKTKAQYKNKDKVILSADWNLIGEYTKEENNDDENKEDESEGNKEEEKEKNNDEEENKEETETYIFKWGWDYDDVDDVPQCQLVKQMENKFEDKGDLAILDNPVIKFHDFMMVNIIMAYTQDITKVDVVAHFESETRDQPCAIFALTNLEWLKTDKVE